MTALRCCSVRKKNIRNISTLTVVFTGTAPAGLNPASNRAKNAMKKRSKNIRKNTAMTTLNI